MEEKIARPIECEQTIHRCQAERWRLIAELNIDEWAAREIAMALQLSQTNGDYLVKWASGSQGRDLRRGAVAWPEGKTTGKNLGPLDRRHHAMSRSAMSPPCRRLHS